MLVPAATEPSENFDLLDFIIEKTSPFICSSSEYIKYKSFESSASITEIVVPNNTLLNKSLTEPLKSHEFTDNVLDRPENTTAIPKISKNNPMAECRY